MTAEESRAKLAVDFCEAKLREAQLAIACTEKVASAVNLTCDSEEYRAWVAQTEECERIFEQWKKASRK